MTTLYDLDEKDLTVALERRVRDLIKITALPSALVRYDEVEKMTTMVSTTAYAIKDHYRYLKKKREDELAKNQAEYDKDQEKRKKAKEEADLKAIAEARKKAKEFIRSTDGLSTPNTDDTDECDEDEDH
jgi:hypothetical protein